MRAIQNVIWLVLCGADGSYHAPASPVAGGDQAGADARGAAGDDGGLLALIAHGVPVGAVAGG